VDAIGMSSSVGQPVLNLASWGMRFSDFDSFPIWKKENTIICNVHFTDFGNSQIKHKPGFPFNQSFWTSKLNILQDFRTYRKQVIDYGNIVSNPKNDFYQALNFDNNGSVVFVPKKEFGLDSARWNAANDSASINFMDRFANELAEKGTVHGLLGNTYENVNEALTAAKKNAHHQDLILVIGSVFLVAEVDRTNFS
jgi:hypothetical protein